MAERDSELPPVRREAPEGYPRSKGTRLAIMSSTMAARSYSGFYPQSARAALSSMLRGQLSAMACRWSGA